MAVPAIVIGNSLWLLLGPWLVDLQYALPGFPEDQLGLDEGRRRDLAVLGVRSIRPLDDGVDVLREARLPSGREAFTEREISHMADVRGVMTGFVSAWAIGLGAMLAGGLALWRRAGRRAVTYALASGGVLTLSLIAVVGLAALIDFEGFFSAFHTVFFEGNSWRFEDADTLLQLYPATFWIVASTLIIGLSVLQAGALASLHPRLRVRTVPARIDAMASEPPARPRSSAHGS